MEDPSLQHCHLHCMQNDTTQFASFMKNTHGCPWFCDRTVTHYCWFQSIRSQSVWFTSIGDYDGIFTPIPMIACIPNLEIEPELYVQPVNMLNISHEENNVEPSTDNATVDTTAHEVHQGTQEDNCFTQQIVNQLELSDDYEENAFANIPERFRLTLAEANRCFGDVIEAATFETDDEDDSDEFA